MKVLVCFALIDLVGVITLILIARDLERAKPRYRR